MKQVIRGLSAVLLTIGLVFVYLFSAGIVSPDLAPPIALLLVSTLFLGYFSGYHTFAEESHAKLPVLLSLLAVMGASVIWILQVSLPPIPLPGLGPPALPQDSFLPDWWLLVVLVPAGIVFLADALLNQEFPDYPSPDSWQELPRSPVFFGAALGVIGFWGVLFVGFSQLQRIIVIAPIFEELLKFGIALSIAGAIFGRSLRSRYTAAIVVGVMFGLAEHSLTYPAEPDLVYLFRVVFHALVAGLGISAYTVFEARDDLRLMWSAPALAILLHFAHNTFAVVTGFALSQATEASLTSLQLGFGLLVILAAGIATILTVQGNDSIREFHRWVGSFAPGDPARRMP